MKKEKKKEKKKEHCCCDKICAVLVIGSFAIIFIVAIATMTMQVGQQNADITLTQEVADEICMQLTGEDYVVASDDYIETGIGNGGNLICDVFDEGSSKGIIVNR